MRPRLLVLSLLAAAGVAALPARASAQRWNPRCDCITPSFNFTRERGLERAREQRERTIERAREQQERSLERARESRERNVERAARSRELAAERASRARTEATVRAARLRVQREFAQEDRMIRAREQAVRARVLRPRVYHNRW